MKTRSSYIIALIAAATVLSGCATGGARPPVNTTQYNFETTAKFATMDDRAQRSVTCTGLQERKNEDGRLEIAANLRNRENRRIEVQTQCLFKDPQGFAIDETPWQTLIMTENGQETLHFTAMNNKATDYEVRVRGAR
jgi:Protein of unknown function (DUF1425)